MCRPSARRVMAILRVRAEKVWIAGITPRRRVANAEHHAASGRIGSRGGLIAVIRKMPVREVQLFVQAMTPEHFVELRERSRVVNLPRPVDRLLDTLERRRKVFRILEVRR